MEALIESILDSSEHARRKCDFHLASKSMTDVIDFGGTSLCRTESLIESEIPYVLDETGLTVKVVASRGSAYKT